MLTESISDGFSVLCWTRVQVFKACVNPKFQIFFFFGSWRVFSHRVYGETNMHELAGLKLPIWWATAGIISYLQLYINPLHNTIMCSYHAGTHTIYWDSFTVVCHRATLQSSRCVSIYPCYWHGNVEVEKFSKPYPPLPHPNLQLHRPTHSASSSVHRDAPVPSAAESPVPTHAPAGYISKG